MARLSDSRSALYTSEITGQKSAMPTTLWSPCSPIPHIGTSLQRSFPPEEIERIVNLHPLDGLGDPMTPEELELNRQQFPH